MKNEAPGHERRGTMTHSSSPSWWRSAQEGRSSAPSALTVLGRSRRPIGGNNRFGKIRRRSSAACSNGRWGMAASHCGCD